MVDAEGHEQPPPSGHQPPHHPRHRGHKALGKKEADALDMDKLSDASAAASLLTVLLEQNLSDSHQAQLTFILRWVLSCALELMLPKKGGGLWVGEGGERGGDSAQTLRVWEPTWHVFP